MDNEQDKSPFDNRIFRMAQERLQRQAEALNPSKSGPKTGHTVEITKLARVVGRNKVPVPFDEVEHLASLGCTDRDIANYFGIKEDTLRRGFAENLLFGRHRLKTSLRQTQLRVALDGNVPMLIWLGRNMLDQNENGQANEDNRPLPWTDDMDNDTVEDLDDETTIQTPHDEDTAFE